MIVWRGVLLLVWVCQFSILSITYLLLYAPSTVMLHNRSGKPQIMSFIIDINYYYYNHMEKKQRIVLDMSASTAP